MKKSFIVLMSLAFLVAACNNNKAGKNQNLNNRDKDDYSKNENSDTGNENTGNKGWSKDEKNAFLKDCMASFNENQGPLSNRICPCALEKLEKEYTSLNEANTKGGEAAGNRVALQCKEDVLGNNDKGILGNNDNNTNSNWSKSDEDKWMKACATPALIEKLGEQKAANYCSCILDKLKGTYSSFEELNTKGTAETGAELGKKCIKELGIGQ